MNPWARKRPRDIRANVTDDDIQRFRRLCCRAGKCLVFVGCIDGDGYGHFKVGGKKVLAHRFAAKFIGGEDIAGKEVHHACGNRRCVSHVSSLPPALHREIHATGVAYA